MALGSTDSNHEDAIIILHVSINDFSDDVALNTQSSKIQSCPTNASPSDETNNLER